MSHIFFKGPVSCRANQQLTGLCDAGRLVASDWSSERQIPRWHLRENEDYQAQIFPLCNLSVIRKQKAVWCSMCSLCAASLVWKKSSNNKQNIITSGSKWSKCGKTSTSNHGSWFRKLGVWLAATWAWCVAVEWRSWQSLLERHANHQKDKWLVETTRIISLPNLGPFLTQWECNPAAGQHICFQLTKNKKRWSEMYTDIHTCTHSPSCYMSDVRPITEQHWTFPWPDITFIHLCLIRFQGGVSVLGWFVVCVFFRLDLSTPPRLIHASLAQEHSVRLASIKVGAHGAVRQMTFRGPERSQSAGAGQCFSTFAQPPDSAGWASVLQPLNCFIAFTLN